MNEVCIQRFPEGMTGKQYRKQLGIELPKRSFASKSFKIKHKFHCIKPKNRLVFLQSMVRKHEQEHWQTVAFGPQHGRQSFDFMKLHVYPMTETCPCYVCSKPADVRHHVIPLMHGGRNKARNIVPLCNNCHAKVHPHLRRKSKKVASRHCVQPQINGPLVGPQDDKKIVFVPASA